MSFDPDFSDFDFELIYSRLQDLPSFVRNLVYNHDGWIVGSGARYLLGLTNSKLTPKDYDVLIPFHCWGDVALTIPRGTPSNSFGGFKVTIEGKTTDVWCGDIGWFLSHSTINNDLALHIRTKTVIRAHTVKLNKN